MTSINTSRDSEQPSPRAPTSRIKRRERSHRLDECVRGQISNRRRIVAAPREIRRDRTNLGAIHDLELRHPTPIHPATGARSSTVGRIPVHDHKLESSAKTVTTAASCAERTRRSRPRAPATSGPTLVVPPSREPSTGARSQGCPRGVRITPRRRLNSERPTDAIWYSPQVRRVVLLTWFAATWPAAFSPERPIRSVVHSWRRDGASEGRAWRAQRRAHCVVGVCHAVIWRMANGARNVALSPKPVRRTELV